MKRALSLARRGLGRVSPNPAVGAVIAKDGAVVGEGYHLWAGKDHAEVVALEKAGSLAEGADIYVTLEPCSHYGRTPPCADAIIDSGISRVFVAVEDPDPRVSGRGIKRLRDNSLQVQVGLCRESALDINEAYFYSVANARPLVTLKLAMSMDARIATGNGDSRWITGSRARQYVHRLRFLNDAVLIGSGTFRADDPLLNVRWNKNKKITRVVLDSSASCLKADSRILESDDPVLVYHKQQAAPVSPAVDNHNVEYIGVPAKEGLLSWQHILDDLGRRNIRSLLAEGGGRIAGSLIRGNYVDKLFLFYSPMFIGSEGIPGIGELGAANLSEAIRFKTKRIIRVADDFCVEANVDKG